MQKRLDKLREYLALLREIGKNAKDDYVNNPLIHGTGERYLHLAAECALDIGNHIVSDQGLGSPGSYREIFFLLGEASVLTPELTNKMQELAGLRNILVHDYSRIDHAITYDVIQNELSWLESYIEAVEKFL
jgi:uncharacterized protein YutE (UPF0331/DUF86 family)